MRPQRNNLYRTHQLNTANNALRIAFGWNTDTDSEIQIQGNEAKIQKLHLEVSEHAQNDLYRAKHIVIIKLLM